MVISNFRPDGSVEEEFHIVGEESKKKFMLRYLSWCKLVRI